MTAIMVYYIIIRDYNARFMTEPFYNMALEMYPEKTDDERFEIEIINLAINVEFINPQILKLIQENEINAIIIDNRYNLYYSQIRRRIVFGGTDAQF